jgi:saccharopine dehydrogenase (NAD+, L-lysine-forming)
MVEACLDTGTHYLDVTGEIPVLQSLADRDEEAKRQEVVVLPAVGFDVVPTDCLARFLSEELPSATLLEIAFAGMGNVSKGTLKTAVRQLGSGGKVRRNGAVTTVPPGWTTRTVDFGDRRRSVMSIPWGDVVTAGHSTGIPNVTVYAALPPVAQTLLRLSRYVQGVLAWPPLQTILTRAVDRWISNPTDEERQQGMTTVWASVRDGAGERRTARLRGPDAYTLTARTAVEAVRRVVSDPPDPGYHTPSTAFGASFVRKIEGVKWQDEDGSS